MRSDELDRLAGLLADDDVELTMDHRGSLVVRGHDAGHIGRVARDADIALSALTPQQRTLEDVFLELTAASVQYHGATTVGSN